MKSIIKIFFACCSLAMMFFASCRKSAGTISTVDSTSHTTVDYTLVNQIYTALKPQSQTIKVQAGVNSTVRAINGTMLNFYPNSFLDQNGNVVKSGIVNVKITEMYNNSAIMESKSSSTADGKLLDMKGQICVTATLNGQVLKANKYGIGFKSEMPMQQRSSYFYGKVNTTDSVITWTSSSVGSDGTSVDSFKIVSVDSNGHGLDTLTIRTNYNRFDSCTTFGWISCASFFASGGVLTNIAVTPTDSMFNNTNTIVYLLYSDIHSSCYLNSYTNTSHTFSFLNGYEVPVGIRTNIIAISNISGHYYYNLMRNIPISSGMSISVRMAPTTLSHLMDELQSL